MPTSDTQLNQVRTLIKSGKKKQAIAELARLIERDHDNPELWWLLANATDDVQQARRALEEMQSLAPGDARASKMLKRLSTRMLLNEIGVERETRSRSRVRPSSILGGLAVALVVVVGAGVFISRIAQPPDDAPLPTLYEMASLPTETATQPSITTEPSSTVQPVARDLPRVEPTLPGQPIATQDSYPPLPQAEITVDALPPQAVSPTFTTDPQVFYTLPNPESTAPLAPPPPTQPPTQQPTPVPPTVDVNGSATAAAFGTLEQAGVVNSAPTINPESTAPVNPQGTVVVPVPSASLVPTSAPDDQGILADGQVQRKLIQAYGSQQWTFSGYRDETITLELVNLSGEGNPVLKLLDTNGQMLAEDFDRVSGNNADAALTVTLPADGIYTVIVQMISVKEQLYSLLLTR